jgi:hypothetical protein
MRRVTAAFALTALAAATIAMAQTTPTDPQASAPPSQQSQAPADPSASSQSTAPSASSESSSSDKQALMKDCLTQVQAANPNVSQKDVKDFCDREVNKRSSSPQ